LGEPFYSDRTNLDERGALRDLAHDHRQIILLPAEQKDLFSNRGWNRLRRQTSVTLARFGQADGAEFLPILAASFDGAIRVSH
jgi:hypothetical protein